jgi:[ribosomal protein S18]-alanine N-acetyltransferase
MGGTDIRLACEADLDGILDLFALVAAERLWIGTEPGFDRAVKRERFRAAILAPHRTPAWVALDGSRVVGHLSIFDHAEAGLALGMMLHRNYRRRGIGRMLLEHSFAWGRERGIPSLALHVFPHNTAARALYRSAGFVEIERYERDVTRQTGDVWDTILMRKTL